ncbi:unnamed protein product, partial [Mesorhabditis belari]|uniref:G-protein coupled receptors family 1 profile domain-containing protein n=1 Tax=Mesorhabditis belari TaxID=2138241 RepID=A0AAF3ELQ3_9BILA
MASWGVSMCTVLGILSLILNLFVITSLIRYRRRVLKNVFYVIVLHCALLDVIRGACLIVKGFPFLISVYVSFENKITLMKATRYITFIMRSCNLVTIFNLVIFTTNEFVVVRYPLHYKRYFRRRTVLLLITICWCISIFFGIASAVSSPLTNEYQFLQGIKVSTVAQITIFFLCYLCLFVVLICYAKILRTIREFHGFDDRQRRFGSANGKRIFGSTQLKEQISIQNSQAISLHSEDPSKKRADSGRKKMHQISRHKYLIVIGSVLFVDVLFLFPYSGIQLVSFLHREGIVGLSVYSSSTTWLLQVLIGIHAVCQPLCYFRMTEFRRLVCCNPKSTFSRSKSISQHKSFANTKSREIDDPEKEALRGSEKNQSPNHTGTKYGPRLSRSNDSMVPLRANQLHANCFNHSQETSISSELKAKSFDSQLESPPLSCSPSDLQNSREIYVNPEEQSHC